MATLSNKKSDILGTKSNNKLIIALIVIFSFVALFGVSLFTYIVINNSDLQYLFVEEVINITIKEFSNLIKALILIGIF